MITQSETILLPHQHRFRIDAFIEDCEYLLSPNRYGEYVFSFIPNDTTQHQILFEHGEAALNELAFGLPSYALDRPTGCYENKMGVPYCSQLFAPEVNETDIYHALQLHGRRATITLHFRDVGNKVYLNAEYVDLYDEHNGYDEEYMNPSGLVDDTDW